MTHDEAMDLSQHRQAVARGLQALETSIERLSDALAHGAVLSKVEPAINEGGPIRRVCEAYAAIDYRMEDEVGTSVVCLGVLGVNAEILRRARAVNVVKTEFRAICTPLQHIRIRIPVKGESSPTKAIPAIRVILRNIQRSDLNLLAAYRKIPILDAPPGTVTYTRANTRAVYRKTIEEVLEILNRVEGSAAMADRARLATLDRRETHLAFVKGRYQNIRANVLYEHLDRRGRGRIQISAELPLIYAKGRRAEAPQVQFPGEAESTTEPAHARKAKLESAPLLQSVPVYRYARSTR
jgi:hypothetical protein